MLDLSRCRPDHCMGRVCAPRGLRPVRAIYQEEPFETPAIDWGRCHACSKCVAAFPLKAISLVN